MIYLLDECGPRCSEGRCVGVTERVRRAGSFPCLSTSLYPRWSARADSSQFRKAASRALAPCCWIYLVWSQNTTSSRLDCFQLNSLQLESLHMMETIGEDRKMDEHLTKENCSTSVSCGPTVLSLLHFTAHSNKEKERSPLIVGGSFSEGNNS